ncbi:MAG: glycosyltransferase family 2 protein [Thermoanaerobaculaceae bacterium]|nr:glycosyltransferase family 2 protein [Thermoanaerobaculaceae bacterium]
MAEAHRPYLTVLIPAYNEALRLPRTLERVAAYLWGRQFAGGAEILVVDDGSQDATAATVERFVAPPGIAVRLLQLERNQGKGAAVRHGLAASRGRWVLLSDADLATPIEELATLEAAGAPVAVGSRGLRRELIQRRQPFPRDLLGRLFNAALRLLGLTRLKDTQCGFKLLEGELARQVASELRLDGFAYDVELLARLERRGVPVREVPVRWVHVDDSRVHTLSHGFAMLRDALRVRRWLRSGR